MHVINKVLCCKKQLLQMVKRNDLKAKYYLLASPVVLLVAILNIRPITITYVAYMSNQSTYRAARQ